LTRPPALMLFRHFFPIVNLPFRSPRSPGMLMCVYPSVYLFISNWVCLCRRRYHLPLRCLTNPDLVTRCGRQTSRKASATLTRHVYVAKYLSRRVREETLPGYRTSKR
jgi:hypothetical protein